MDPEDFLNDDLTDGLAPNLLVQMVRGAVEHDRETGTVHILYVPSFHPDRVYRWSSHGEFDLVPPLSSLDYNRVITAGSTLRALQQYEKGDEISSDEWSEAVIYATRLDAAERALHDGYIEPHHLDEFGNVVVGMTELGQHTLETIREMLAEPSDIPAFERVPVALMGVLSRAEERCNPSNDND